MDRLHHLVDDLLERDAHPDGDFTRHVGDDKARCDRIGGDPKATEFECHGFCQPLDPGLRRSIICFTDNPECGDARQVDDPSPAGGAHVPLDLPRHQEDRAQIDVDHDVPVVERHLGQRAIADDTGIVDEHCGRAEPVDNRSHPVTHCLLVGNVGGHG